MRQKGDTERYLAACKIGWCTIRNLLIQILLTAINILPVAAVGYLLNRQEGLIVALCVVMFLLVFAYLFADKIMLIILEAKFIAKPLLGDSIKNFRCRYKVRSVCLYRSYKYPSNIYLVQSLIGKPSIVIGHNVLENLAKQEIEALLFSSLLQINWGHVKYKTLVTTVLSPFYLPPYFKRAIPNLTLNLLYSLITYVFYPFEMLRILLLKRFDLRSKKQREMSVKIIPEHALTAAIFKISQYQHVSGNRVLAKVVDGLSLVNNSKNDVLSSLNTKEY
ncbi:MAG: hypothetical protein ISR65_00430 [Bacteriovoracaceae bacterium]|nr:hypothetical protein [Bacteriovoracaceae bacterium]